MKLERRFARHFSERPPVQLEAEQTTEHGPRIIVTNVYQYSLTAFVVQTEPQETGDTAQTLIIDALTHVALPAAIPRGLSYTMGVPHAVGGRVPDAKLAAAVWEDGSSYGPDNLLARISSARRVLADSYDRAIATLQTGLEKNWSAQEYLSAAQELGPADPPKAAATLEEARVIGESFVAASLPSHTIADNMQRAARENQSAARVASHARAMLKVFTRDRDSLRQALTSLATSTNPVSSR